MYSPLVVPENIYHADPTSLSSTGARTLIRQTPKQFYNDRHEPQKPKPEYDFGHCAHKMVLGEGNQFKVMDPKIHGLTADGKQSQKPTATGMWKATEAKARLDGLTPITKAQMETAQRMAGVVFDHPLARNLFTDGTAEMSGYWHDDATRIRCRLRTDWITEPTKRRPRRIVVDYKQSTSAEVDHFEDMVFKFGYHQQQAWYEDGLIQHGFEGFGFVFVLQSNKPPYDVAVCEIDPEIVDLGRRLNRRAIEIYAECEASNEWPGIPPVVHRVGMSNWRRERQESLLHVAS
nr:PD-(D/E)XK nuclease-like domain-containing protein [Mycolicibacterium fluoranthenivorans]